MKKLTIAVMMVLLLGVSAYAADAQDPGADFWKSMLSKIGQFVPKKKIATETSIAGIRGASQEGETLYWKGEAENVVVSEKELEQFKAAVEKALSGEREQALRMFQDFSKAYPESPLRIDSQQAIGKLTRGNPTG
ncbi:MAG: hypothetical protein A2V65_01940 [Deltaproteobacteria bacterium RBG_13_49_15]|nr:MAG: hypothetical protein A2V65_01940 [Deltaproteobacteria bacterium RBG_13_49_15]